MSTTTEQLTLQLRTLPPEPWGVRLRRAREMHGFSQDEAAARIADFIETSGATLSRLEKLDRPPTSRKRRRLAWALCVSYGVDPEDLGLTDHDRPPLVVVTAIFKKAWSDLAALEGTPRIHDQPRLPFLRAV